MDSVFEGGYGVLEFLLVGLGRHFGYFVSQVEELGSSFVGSTAGF